VDSQPAPAGKRATSATGIAAGERVASGELLRHIAQQAKGLAERLVGDEALQDAVQVVFDGHDPPFQSPVLPG
jgi:hypothetical protein